MLQQLYLHPELKINLPSTERGDGGVDVSLKAKIVLIFAIFEYIFGLVCAYIGQWLDNPPKSGNLIGEASVINGQLDARRFHFCE